jgi:hypothetical protein
MVKLTNKDIINEYKKPKAMPQPKRPKYNKMTPYLIGIGVPTICIGAPIGAAFISPIAGIVVGGVVCLGVVNIIGSALGNIRSDNMSMSNDNMSI